MLLRPCLAPSLQRRKVAPSRSIPRHREPTPSASELSPLPVSLGQYSVLASSDPDNIESCTTCCATSRGPYVHHSAKLVQTQDSNCRSEEGTMGAPSPSTFFIFLLWVHSCPLAGVSPLRTFVSALFSWLPSPRKIRHRRHQFRDNSKQLAHRRGARGQVRCLESRFLGKPAGSLWPRIRSQSRCLTLMALLVSPGFFLCFSCPGCFNPAPSFPVGSSFLGRPRLPLCRPVFLALSDTFYFCLLRILLSPGLFVLHSPRSCCLIGFGSHERHHEVFQLELDLHRASYPDQARGLQEKGHRSPFRAVHFGASLVWSASRCLGPATFVLEGVWSILPSRFEASQSLVFCQELSRVHPDMAQSRKPFLCWRFSPFAFPVALDRTRFPRVRMHLPTS